MNLGGSWNFGFLKLYGLWHEGKLGGLKETFFDVGVGVPLGQGEFKFSFADVSDRGTQSGVNIDNSDATQWALQYIYNLSKRTAIYGGYAEIDNDAGSSRSILNGTIGSNAGPQIGNGTGTAITQLSGKKSTGFNFGVRHSF
jgi:predicted porin